MSGELDDVVIPPLDPANAKTLTLHPAIVEGVQEDPELLVQMSRAQLAVVQDRMVKRALESNDTTIGQLAVVHERLSKNAKLEPQQGAAAGHPGTQVVINFIRAPGKEKVVIDSTPQQVIDVKPA